MNFIHLVSSFLLLLCMTFPAQTETCIDKSLLIAIDVGHSPEHAGATSARGRKEYEFNLNLAQRLHQRLLRSGFHNAFILTAQNPEMPLHARASLASARRADLLISIHHDSTQTKYMNYWEYEGELQRYSDDFHGYSIFVSEKNKHYENSLYFAELLGEELLSLEMTPTLHHAEAIEGENRPLLNVEKGIYRFDDLILLKKAKVPAILLECGVIVNREEELALLNLSYQQTLIAALERSILRFASMPSLD